MRQPMSGEENLKSGLDSVLDEYEKSTGLNLKIDLKEIELYLGLTREQMEGYSSEGCAQVALKLTQYSLLLQKMQNRERAKLSWADHQIGALCAPQWKNYDKYTPKEIRIELIAAENPALTKVLGIKKHALVRSSELDGLSYIVKYYAETMNMLGKAKWQNKM